MSKILLSINPKYVDEIFCGLKKYEYRKVVLKKKPSKVYVYSTYPTMKVVGEFEIADILVDEPDQVWELTHRYSGISKEEYDKYYHGKKVAIAYKINNAVKYSNFKELSDFGIKRPPQSFIYVQV